MRVHTLNTQSDTVGHANKRPTVPPVVAFGSSKIFVSGGRSLLPTQSLIPFILDAVRMVLQRNRAPVCKRAEP